LLRRRGPLSAGPRRRNSHHHLLIYGTDHLHKRLKSRLHLNIPGHHGLRWKAQARRPGMQGKRSPGTYAPHRGGCVVRGRRHSPMDLQPLPQQSLRRRHRNPRLRCHIRSRRHSRKCPVSKRPVRPKSRRNPNLLRRLKREVACAYPFSSVP